MMTGKQFALGGLELTHPAVVALVGYVALIIVVLLPFDMYTYDTQERRYVKVQYNFMYRLLLALLLMVPFFLSVYSINCMMVGDCQAWSWIVAILTIIWAFTIAVVAISMGSFTMDQLL
jgi:fumarate reductase subunit D